jgi:hypothetical protein
VMLFVGSCLLAPAGTATVCCCLQSSVWGSGSAGIFCALMALLTGDYTLWQVSLTGCSKLVIRMQPTHH